MQIRFHTRAVVTNRHTIVRCVLFACAFSTCSTTNLHQSSSGPMPVRAPQYAPPQFDTSKTALAIGRISPIYGGTVVAISPNGLAVTAYHAVSRCVARLRRDRTTRAFFHEDGSYYGEHGPLLCDDLSIEFPHLRCANGGDRSRVDWVYLVAVPPASRAMIITDPLVGSESPAIPELDVALLKLDEPVPGHLPLSPDGPRPSEPLWAAGYLSTAVRPVSGRAALIAFKTKQALMHALAEAAIDPARGVAAAQAFLSDSHASHDLKGDDSDAGFVSAAAGYVAQLDRAASGPDAALSVVRQWILDKQGGLERCASDLEVAPETADACRRDSDKLRGLVEFPRGAELQQVFAAQERSYARLVAQIESDILNADDSTTAVDWCGVPVFCGNVTAMDFSTFRSSAFSGLGMSGGPALNAAGEVVGLMIAERQAGLAYRPDNLVLVRSDLVLREFSPVLQDENRWSVAHSPTPGRAAQEHAEAILRKSGLVQFRWIDPSPDSNGLWIRLKRSAHAVHVGAQAPLNQKDITFADVRIQDITMGCGTGTPDCRESIEHVPSVRIVFSEFGARKLRDLTAQNTGKYLGIIVDGQLLAIPAIINEVTEGQLHIGRVSNEDAQEIAAKINAARDDDRRPGRP